MNNIQHRFETIEADIKEINIKLDSPKLSDEDVNKIVDRVCEKIEARMYHDVGQGVVSLAWKGVLILMIAIAAYGAGVTKIFKYLN